MTIRKEYVWGIIVGLLLYFIIARQNAVWTDRCQESYDAGAKEGIKQTLDHIYGKDQDDGIRPEVLD